MEEHPKSDNILNQKSTVITTPHLTFDSSPESQISSNSTSHPSSPQLHSLTVDSSPENPFQSTKKDFISRSLSDHTNYTHLLEGNIVDLGSERPQKDVRSYDHEERMVEKKFDLGGGYGKMEARSGGEARSGVDGGSDGVVGGGGKVEAISGGGGGGNEKVEEISGGGRKVEAIRGGGGRKVEAIKGGGGGGKGGRFRPIMRGKREKMVKMVALGFRVVGAICCLISFSVMAADKNKGWALDSFHRYKEFRYSLSVNVIGFVYSVGQAFDSGFYLATGKYVLEHPYRYYFDFAVDQIVTYLLISASSSASTRIDDWQLNWGKDKFPDMATASVAISFLAFVAIAFSSLISGYTLCTSKLLQF
ncbi:hypothetical protein LIER_27575 [Lithospermum erythrorhizon]|uniref:CASP-like protein n=1 Tax=Lithospermum erythrorhizon TaxID=34254 RepID=A0AAV3RGG1_LITER